MKGSIENIQLNETDINEKMFNKLSIFIKLLNSKKLYHNDIKPENIMYTEDEQKIKTFYLGDFGLVSPNWYYENGTQIGILGTPNYCHFSLLQMLYPANKAIDQILEFQVKNGLVIENFQTYKSTYDPDKVENNDLVDQIIGEKDMFALIITTLSFVTKLEPDNKLKLSTSNQLQLLSQPPSSKSNSSVKKSPKGFFKSKQSTPGTLSPNDSNPSKVAILKIVQNSKPAWKGGKDKPRPKSHVFYKTRKQPSKVYLDKNKHKFIKINKQILYLNTIRGQYSYKLRNLKA